MKLVLYRPPLRLQDLAAYRKIRAAADMQRAYYERAIKQVQTIVGKLQETYCEAELDEIEDCQRRIRLLTKGTPLTESLAPEDKEPVLFSDPNHNQRQYDAHTVLLRKAWRNLAPLCHPDKGGDKEVFQEAQTAYKMRDLERLVAIYLSIAQGRNLYWQQADGLYHVSSEYERYGVKIEMYRQLPAWRAARLYLAGQVNSAVNIVRLDLAERIYALNNEIHYLTFVKGNQNGEERTTEVQEIQQDRKGCEIEGEGSEVQESGRQGAEPAGEGTPGQGIGQGAGEIGQVQEEG
jgi:hypothetical protein